MGKLILYILATALFTSILPQNVRAQIGVPTAEPVDNLPTPELPEQIQFPDTNESQIPQNTETPDSEETNILSSELENEKKEKLNLDMSFTKYKTDHNPSEVYFNVLKITNNTNKPIQGLLRISIPENWTRVLQIVGDAQMTIAPGKTEYIPVRLGLPKLITGGLAYVISAEFVDNEDVLLTPSAYCYINIPRVSEWKLKTETRYFYVSETETLKKVGFRFENRGNAQENLKIDIELGKNLEVPGVTLRNIVTSLILAPYSDTTIEYQVKYNPEYTEVPSISDNRIVVKAQGEDDKLPKSVNFWFEQIKSRHENELVETESPLIVSLNVYNLLTEDGVITVQGGIRGTILLNNNRNIRYQFFNGNIFNINSDRTFRQNYYDFSRFFVGYNTKNWGIGLGDVNVSGWMVPAGGRGINGYYKKGDHSLMAGATRNIFNPVYSVGGTYTYRILPNMTLLSGITLRLDNVRNYTSIIPSLGARYRFNKQSASALFSISNINLAGNNIVGYGHRLNYNSTYFKNFTINANNQYTNRNFLDVGGNNSVSNLGVIYALKNAQTLTLQYSSVLSKPSTIGANATILDLGRRDFHIINTIYSRSFENGLTFNGGPGYQYYYYEDNFSFSPQFQSDNYQAMLGISKRNMKKRQNSINGNVVLAYTYLTTFEGGVPTEQDPYLNASFTLNNRWNRSGLLLGYYYGAPSYTTQRYFANGGEGNKSIRINPYFNQTFYENKLNVNLNAAYWYQVNDKTTRITLYSFLEYILEKGWSLNANVLLYNYARVEAEAGRQSYTDINLNLGVQKMFDLPQPRGRYHDVKVVFFKDVNGNRVKDENEVGIPNIIVKIENKKDSLNISADQFYSLNLMTDQFGQIECIRMPADAYHLSTNQIEGMGEYISELGEEFDITVDEDKVLYVPYIKSNKVYGKIVIKRDPFSSMGYVSPGNIRITATDTRGNEYATLSDKDGNFLLFAPQAGRYTVKIKNIFGDKFKLRQKEFVIDFNGLKEFKITFLFEENKRKINFKGDINGFNFAEENNKNEDGNNTANNSADEESNSSNTSTETNAADRANEALGGFDEIAELGPTPFRKDRIFFMVQVGAYNLEKSADIVQQLRSTGKFEESITPYGLTRFTLGEFASRAEAEAEKQRLVNDGTLPNTQYITVVGEYFGKYLTADEAEALKND